MFCLHLYHAIILIKGNIMIVMTITQWLVEI